MFENYTWNRINRHILFLMQKPTLRYHLNTDILRFKSKSMRIFLLFRVI